MPHMMGGLSNTTFGFQGSGVLNTYWTPPTQLQWERIPGQYDGNDDLTVGAFEYIADPTLATDALFTRRRGELQMRQLLAT